MSFLLRIGVGLGAIGMAFSASAAPPTHAGNGTHHDLRVMTFNVRYPSRDDGVNVWPKRRSLMVKVIRKQDPDILGTQELYERQGRYLASHLKHYTWFGLGRNGNNDGGHSNEHMGVFYKTARLRVINSGNFWLSDTPDVPGSNTWDQPFPRMVTWAEFQVKATGKRFYYYNTHLPYRAGDGYLRERGAKIIRKRIAKVPASLPVILAGDFNSAPDKPTHDILTKALQDAWESAPIHHGPPKTFQGFTGHPTERIDWILYRGLKPDDVSTITTHHGAVYPSDHFAVVADFSWHAAH